MKKSKKSTSSKKDIDPLHIADKLGEMGKILDSYLKNIGEKIEKKSRFAKGLSLFHLTNVKKEAEDIKKALEKKDLIYLKTDALVVVIRKLGGLDEFLAVFEKLTKEGYLLVWTEPVSSILPYGTGFVGTFYYLQKGKLIG